MVAYLFSVAFQCNFATACNPYQKLRFNSTKKGGVGLNVTNLMTLRQCLLFLIGRKRTRTHLNADVRWASAHSRRAGNDTLFSSSPVTRAISSTHNGFKLWTLDFLSLWVLTAGTEFALQNPCLL